MQGLELLVAAVAIERLKDMRLYVRCDSGGIGLPGRGLPAKLRREPLLAAAWQQVAGAVLPAVLRKSAEGGRGPLAQVTTVNPQHDGHWMTGCIYEGVPPAFTVEHHSPCRRCGGIWRQRQVQNARWPGVATRR